MARPTSIHHATVFAEVTIDVGSVSANTTLDVTADVPGLRPGRPLFFWTETDLNDGILYGQAHCAVANTLAFRVINTTGSGVNPDETTFMVVQY